MLRRNLAAKTWSELAACTTRIVQENRDGIAHEVAVALEYNMRQILGP